MAFSPLSTVFQSYDGDNLHYSCLSWFSPVLGRGSEVTCPRTLPRKNPEDQVWLEDRTAGLRVKHFTTEPCWTPFQKSDLTLYHTIPTFNKLGKPFENIVGKGENTGTSIFSFSHNVFYLSQNKFQFFSHIYFVVCKCFQFQTV